MIEARYHAMRRAPGCAASCPCRLPKLVDGVAISVFSTGDLRIIVESRLQANAFSFHQVEAAVA